VRSNKDKDKNTKIQKRQKTNQMLRTRTSNSLGLWVMGLWLRTKRKRQKRQKTNQMLMMRTSNSLGLWVMGQGLKTKRERQEHKKDKKLTKC
jgi:hypothetical protein